jgi:hypothetical protein
VATGRKLAILFWRMLIRGEDYAHEQPSLTRKKTRRLEITRRRAEEHPPLCRDLVDQRADADAERELAEQAEASYKRTVKDQRAGAPARQVKVGASATPERASI